MQLNNKTIILGTVNMDWHLAKGSYTCSCANTEKTNAFDRAICGILNRNNGSMPKLEIATILGFNVIDNPSKNRYVDISERAIFDKAVASLVNYQLVIDLGNEVSLTCAGKQSVETNTKLRIKDYEVELWVSEFLGSNLNEELVRGLSINSVDFETHPEWNSLYTSPEETLRIQRKELVDSDAGRSVKSMKCDCMEYYVATLKCKICYNMETQQLYACAYSDSRRIDDLLSNNIIQDKLLDNFFSGKNLSVLYKPFYQEDKERFLLRQEHEIITYSNIVVCKEDFMANLSENINMISDCIPIVFFSLHKVTESFKKSIQRLDNVVVCVDYVEGEFEEMPIDNNCIIEQDICYYHIDDVRTSDFCVCDKMYYSILPFVVNYKGLDYNIPLVYEYSESEGYKYNNVVLYAPYIDHILDRHITIAQDYLAMLQRHPSPLHVNTVLKSCINLFGILNCAPDDQNIQNKAEELNNIAEEMKDQWFNSLHERLDNLDAQISSTDINELQSHYVNILEQIESDAQQCILHDTNVLSRISDIKQRMVHHNHDAPIPTPNIQLQTVYIIDTNVFMDMPKVLDQFDLTHDKIVIPRAMEQELDGLAHDADITKKERARMARLQLRRKKEDFPHFVSIHDNVNRDLLPTGFDHNIKDNDMLATAIELESRNNIDKIIIVTNDFEFISNIKDCLQSKSISERIEGIDLNELQTRLGD